jgi:hypothetical protein
MNDGDRRIANMRLQSGGEVTPENARHMGLFVVGRLAARHGLRVGLRGPTTDERSAGTTAEVYLPPSVLVEGLVAGPAASPAPVSAAGPAAARAVGLVGPQARVRVAPPSEPVRPVDSPDAVPASDRNGFGPPITLLPRRTPGSSGITDVPAQPGGQAPKRRELATPWWEKGGVQQEPEPAEPQPTERQQAPAAAQAPSDTSAFFAARHSSQPAKPASIPPVPASADDDVIYQGMLAEWLSDPHDLVQSHDLDWQSVWDRGWSLAAEAEDKPIESRTDHGLPVRTPGAQLVPGAGVTRSAAGQDGSNEARQSQDTAPVRDPEAVRASIGSHFGGVHSGREHSHETGRSEQE